ncbi:NlpC/P60 family protein [Streptosporangium sp. NPDC004631]
MGEFTAGDVIVPVVPSAKGFITDLKKQILPAAVRVGTEVGESIMRGIQARIRPVTVQATADTSAAGTALEAVRQQAARLAGEQARVRVDADTSAAQAALAASLAGLARVDGRTARVKVDADIAAAVGQLAAVDAGVSRVDGRTAHARVDVDVAGALAGIGTVTAALAAMPAVAAGALGAGALGGTLLAAGAGFGALAAVAVPSLKRISEASKEQEKATKAASGATTSAAQATTSAAQAAAEAASQSAALEQAERRITDAKVAAKQAEEGLTEARRAAKQAAEDLARSVANAALSEESAALSVEEARQRAAEVAADPKATELERKRADLAVREAEQRHKESVAQTRKLSKEQKAADKAGIKGSAQVVAAKDKIKKANQAVKDSEAQLKLLRLQQTAAKEKPKAAPAVGPAGVEAKKFDELSPAAQTASKQIDAFKTAYEKWQKALEPKVLPAVTGGLKILKSLLKPLSPLITGSADALVKLEKSASKALGGKFWKDFFGDVSAQAPTAITGLVKSLGSAATGVAGVIKVFLPFVPVIVGGIQKAAAAFATWATGLGKSQAFQGFIAYAKANAPLVAELFRNVGTAVGKIVSALAPFGPPALAGLSGLAGLIAKLPPGVIAGIAAAIGAVVLGVKAWGIAQTILNVAMSDNPIGLIVAGIALLAAGLVYAYQNSQEFRQVVDTALKAVGEAATWLWQNAIKPAFDGISAAVSWAWGTVIKPAFSALKSFVSTVLGPAISWLWNTVIVPAWKGISAAVKTAWDNVIQPALEGLRRFITETLAPKISWLWENVIKPAWKGIGEAIDTAWTKVIKPAFDSLKTFITETIPNAFDKGVGMIKTAWDKIQDYAKKPVNFIIGTVYNGGIVKLWNTVNDALGLDLKLKEIPQLAQGGIYPGYTPGRDVGLAAVSGGEAIMRPEWTRAVGADYVHSANKAARTGGVSGAAKFMGGFASGGIIGDLLAKGVKVGAEQFLNPLLDKASAAMGDSQWAKLLVGVPKKMVADVITFLSGKDAETGGLSGGKAVAYARAQVGKPYQWGATGPGSFDCSGLTMRALQAAGYDPPRVSQAQMRWVEPVSKPQAGYLGFPHSGHVWLYSGPDRIIEAPQTGLNVREVAARAAQVIGKPPAYDSGGYLMPGTSLVHNGTGRPEPVLTDRQWQAISQGGGARGGDGPLVNIEGGFHTTPEQSPYAIAGELRYLLGRGVRAAGR